MTPRSKAAAGALAIVTIGFLASNQPVPIYDGLGFPDQPYRLIGNGTRGEPSVATGTANVDADGSSEPLSARSNESGPQVVFELGAGAFRGAPGSTLTLTATPVPTTDPPSAGTADSNTYRVIASSTAGTVTQTASAAKGFVFLRAVKLSDPRPQIFRRMSVGAPWTTLPSSRTGQDIVSASYAGTGDYLLLRPTGAHDARQGSGVITRFFEIAFGLLLLTILILLTRRAGKGDKT